MEEINLREREVCVCGEKKLSPERQRQRQSVCVWGAGALDGECKESVCVV